MAVELSELRDQIDAVDKQITGIAVLKPCDWIVWDGDILPQP